jgi:2-amino-4-hydroxy-6-hydroxymethyldihydropteridine diphosphokinase
VSPAVLPPKPQRLRPVVPVVLALGSNLGDREATIRGAIADIGAVPGIQVDAVSPLVETPALKAEGVDTSAPAYLNGVAIVQTILEPHALLDALNAIEHEHGRVRVERWGDRTLDIDIIDFAGRVLSDERLTLPHPRAWERGFVLAPWLALDPDAEIVGRGRVDALLAATSDTVWAYPRSANRADASQGSET